MKRYMSFILILTLVLFFPDVGQYYHSSELEVFRTDADTVKELVEIKFLAKKRNIRFRTPSQRLFTMNSEVLTDIDATTHVTENL